jgi:hypothetical protein
MPTFYNGKQFFLTYPQFDHSNAKSLITFLRTKGTIAEYIVAKELHEDGSPHIHVCVRYESTVKGSVRHFDFNEKHPNKQDPRNWSACKQYCKKGGDFEEWSLGTECKEPMDLAERVSTYEKEEDWMSWCALNAVSYQYATWFWNRFKSDLTTITEGDDQTKQYLCEALSTFTFNADIHKCFIINGPSGCGKTTWAKLFMPKPTLFVSHIDQLKSFRPGYHKSIIFDDVDFKHWPRHSQIHLCDFDNPRAIHCRYATANIPSGIYKCFTSNVLPLDTTDQAIRRRVKTYNIKYFQ